MTPHRLGRAEVAYLSLTHIIHMSGMLKRPMALSHLGHKHHKITKVMKLKIKININTGIFNGGLTHTYFDLGMCHIVWHCALFFTFPIVFQISFQLYYYAGYHSKCIVISVQLASIIIWRRWSYQDNWGVIHIYWDRKVLIA